MENNNKKTTAIIIAIIIIILIGVGFYYSSKKRGTQAPTTEEQIQLNEGGTGKYEITSINAKHQYKNGKHIYTGVINLPSPCHTVEVKAVPMGGNKYTLEFTTKTTDEACAQVITQKTWRVEFAAPKNITVDATLDGRNITINVFEVKEGQDIDTVEFNEKG